MTPIEILILAICGIAGIGAIVASFLGDETRPDWFDSTWF